MVDREPVEMLDPEVRGIFASAGIQKGKPFDPDDRMKKILTEGRQAVLANERYP